MHAGSVKDPHRPADIIIWWVTEGLGTACWGGGHLWPRSRGFRKLQKAERAIRLDEAGYAGYRTHPEPITPRPCQDAAGFSAALRLSTASHAFILVQTCTDSEIYLKIEVSPVRHFIVIWHITDHNLIMN